LRRTNAELTQDSTEILCCTIDFVREAFDLIAVKGGDESLGDKAEALVKKLQCFTYKSTNSTQDKTGFGACEAFSIDQASKRPDSEVCESIVFEENIKYSLTGITDDLRERFITESDELLNSTEQMLLSIKEDPENNLDLIVVTCRAIHSFKGNCGMMGLEDLEQLSHSMETVLEKVRECIDKWNQLIFDGLLSALANLREGVADVSQGGNGVINDIRPMRHQLDSLIPDETVQNITEVDHRGLDENRTYSDEQCHSEALNDSNDAIIRKADSKRIRKSSTGKCQPTESKIKSRLDKPNIRVDLEKVDLLINLVGEFVIPIAESMVINNPDLKDYEFENFDRASVHFKRIVRELQDVAMSVRMIPISGTFRKMYRLIHDLSSKTFKPVNLEIRGEETEIDKTVAELISDPLVHIIRNAVDHGIETQAERKKTNKDSTGTVMLEASHDGGEVRIIVRDDGRGLNRENILAKGIERGLVQGDGVNMSDNDIYSLIFQPGFTTVDKITAFSGRGVGMDVVKKNIEMLKGDIDIYTIPGSGSMFVIRIPLTLAIIEGMLVRVGEARYTLPILSVKESLRINPSQITKTMDGQELVNVRDELIPIVRLCELHNIKPDNELLEHGILVIIDIQKESVALFVDEILGQHQAVIKELSDYIGTGRSVSGCAILGDGDISLILDPTGINKIASERGASNNPYIGECIAESSSERRS